MPATTLHDCPLCESLATFDASDDGRLKHFLCVVCTEFVVSVEAEKLLAAASSQERESLSNAAQATAGQDVLLVSVDDPGRPNRLRVSAIRWDPSK